MGDITQAFYDRLSGDGTLTALLATYNGQPAIFTTDPVPENADFPMIVCAGDVSQVPFDTKTTLGREIRRDIRCYTLAAGSTATVESIAERVRTLFHRASFAVPNFTQVLSRVVGGPVAADGNEVYGRIVTVRLIVEE